jgi:hypothetical protein
MKAIFSFALSCLTIAALLVCGPAFGKERVRAARLGVGAAPIFVSGLKDAHVSDWQNFPIGSGSEGRVLLPLGQGNVSGVHPGVELGATWPTSIADLMIGGELGFYPGDATGLRLMAGADYFFHSTDAMDLGLSARLGFAGAMVGLGTAAQLPGYRAPVITNEGTFDDGATMSGSMGGIAVGVGLTGAYALSPSMAIRVDLGYQKAFISGLDITAKSGEETVVFDASSPAIVKTDGTSTQAGLNPSADATGFVGHISIQVYLP